MQIKSVVFSYWSKIWELRYGMLFLGNFFVYDTRTSLKIAFTNRNLLLACLHAGILLLTILCCRNWTKCLLLKYRAFQTWRGIKLQHSLFFFVFFWNNLNNSTLILKLINRCNVFILKFHYSWDARFRATGAGVL